MIRLPPEAFSGRELVKYIFMRVKDQEMGGPEDEHIDFWVGNDPEEAPEGYELLYEPE